MYLEPVVQSVALSQRGWQNFILCYVIYTPASNQPPSPTYTSTVNKPTEPLLNIMAPPRKRAKRTMEQRKASKAATAKMFERINEERRKCRIMIRTLAEEFNTSVIIHWVYNA